MRCHVCSTADNNTNFAESGPYLDNRPQALEGAEIDSDAISLVSTAKSDATNVSRQNQASYARVAAPLHRGRHGGSALVLLVALALCLWLVRPTRKAGIGAPLQSTIEPWLNGTRLAANCSRSCLEVSSVDLDGNIVRNGASGSTRRATVRVLSISNHVPFARLTGCSDRFERVHRKARARQISRKLQRLIPCG